MRLNGASLELGALMFLLVLGTPALAQEAFVKSTDKAGTLPEDKSPTVVRAINVTVDVGQLNANNRSLRIAAFDNRVLELELDRIEPIPGRGFIWYGRLVKEPDSSVVFTVVGGIVSGNIDTQGGKVYQIRYAGGGVYSLREIDRTKFPDEAAPRLRPPRPPAPPPPPPGGSCADSPRDIDALIVYTQAARIAAGGKDAMEGIIYLAVAETNQIYLNSQIDQSLRVAHVEEVSYTETGILDTDLTSLEDGTDGKMDNVQALRDTFAADVVSLITETGDSCGLGNVMAAGMIDHSFESLAYSVTTRACAAGNFSLAHEIGHNMGAHHVVGNGAYVYSHAFARLIPTNSAVGPWRTVMADQTFPIASTRVRQFSNPNVNYPSVGGDPTGFPFIADNHLTLNNTALIVANFRCSSPGAPNVWMKDTWDDTGLEPDPRTAGEDMWKSPYIWVRNTQDLGLVHQHEHENPVFGSPNWVYVKLQNGASTDASGNLELYWANASVSLTWPASWTLLSSVPVSAFAAQSTKIVEVPWSSLPGAGHYCLVARWNSMADPMTTAEGPDIDANVRANNNLVWRNLNIVDLSPGGSGDAMMNIMNPDPESGAISIVIRSSGIRGRPSFLATGQVVVEFDETLLKGWREGGARGSGFTLEGDRVIIGGGGATFENLILPYKRGGRLKLIFRRLPATPKMEYVVDVVQRRPAKFAAAQKLSAVVGGISYEIHTDRDYIRR